MKKLVGDWVADQKDESGKQAVMSSFKLTSNGSVLHETIFPGTDHEMVTVYHMDGPDLIATHYCAAGQSAAAQIPGQQGPEGAGVQERFARQQQVNE